MKICYIAHPIGGDVEANLADLRRIVKKINVQAAATIVPFVPYYADVVSMDDSIPEERARGIKNDHAILRSGLVNEMWLTGSRLSPGMKSEVRIAEEMNIPVINFLNLL